MQTLSTESELHPVDLVWKLASQRMWIRRRDLEREVPFGPRVVEMTLDFLVKYGFAQIVAKDKFTMSPSAPSPKDMAQILRSIPFAALI